MGLCIKRINRPEIREIPDFRPVFIEREDVGIGPCASVTIPFVGADPIRPRRKYFV